MSQHYQGMRGYVGLAACVNLPKIKINPVHQLCASPATARSPKLSSPRCQAALDLQQQQKGKGGWFAAELASAERYGPDSCLG